MKRLAWIVLPFLAGCGAIDGLCEEEGCFFTEAEWSRLESLANLEPPEADPVNRYSEDDGAAMLGQMFFFDTRMSGTATQIDTTGQRSAPARAPRGEPIEISCATCHDPRRGGTDHTSAPGNVSVGAGWYDVNAQPVINAAYYDLAYWNGRYDSMVWQAMSVAESGVSMNGNRVRIARIISDHYKDLYEAVFTDDPLPDFGRTAAEQALLMEADGQCTLDAGRCPDENDCVEDASGCWPRWPLDGKGSNGTCNRDTGLFNDNLDCMTEADREAIFVVYFNFAKALAAYEQRLVSNEAPFDRFVNEGPDSEILDDAAKRGAKLFVGKASCIDCHSTALFSDNEFHNVGAPQVGPAVPDDSLCSDDSPCTAWGAFLGLTLLQRNTAFRADSEEFSDDPTDRTRQRFYDLEITDDLKGAWRTPSLREVARTAPYMHTGVYQTLYDVVEHYDRGGTELGAAPEQRDRRIRRLGLTEGEKRDLVRFLESLTGDPLPDELVTSPDLP